MGKISGFPTLEVQLPTCWQRPLNKMDSQKSVSMFKRTDFVGCAYANKRYLQANFKL